MGRVTIPNTGLPGSTQPREGTLLMTKNSKPQDSKRRNEEQGKRASPGSRETVQQYLERVRSMTKEEGRKIHREKMRSLGAGLTLQFGDNVLEEPSPDQGDSH